MYHNYSTLSSPSFTVPSYIFGNWDGADHVHKGQFQDYTIHFYLSQVELTI